jgi:hypothetical protein
MQTRLTKSVICFALALAPATCALGPVSITAQDKDGAGAVISGKATAKDVGLPIYPGSTPHKDKDDDSAAANLGLWGGGAGFKLVVLKMESADAPEKLVTFYKKALSKYGPVLDCSNPAASANKTPKDDSSNTLTCDDNKPEKGGYVFKAGTKEKHHLVAIQPNGQGTLYQLLNIGAWGKK